MKAVKLYAIPDNIPSAVSQWKDMGLDTVMFGSVCLSDDSFLSYLRAEGLKWSIIEPIYLADENDNPVFLAVDKNGDPAVSSWVRFACPSNTQWRSSVLHRLEKHASLKPDGISLDFIRFFQFWEMTPPDAEKESLIQTCFCPSCVSSFASYCTLNKSGTIFDWRCDVIYSMVRDAVLIIRRTSPPTLIGLHSVPWLSSAYNGGRRNLLGQDLSVLSPLVDYITPMIYHHMIGRPPFFINELVIDHHREAGGNTPIIPCIQVRPYYTERPLDLDEFTLSIKEALSSPSQGIVFFQWNDFVNDTEKYEVAKQMLRYHFCK